LNNSDLNPEKSEDKPKFEFFDVTADTGYWAYGSTLDESFENAGLAMFNVMTDTRNVSNIIKKQFTIESEDKVSLLYDWLEELLFRHDVDFMYFSSFNVNISPINKGYKLDAEVWGEEINSKFHERLNEVKAVTFHLMEVNDESGYSVRVILDL
jgi:SHS2 domain-containing protein